MRSGGDVSFGRSFAFDLARVGIKGLLCGAEPLQGSEYAAAPGRRDSTP